MPTPTRIPASRLLLCCALATLLGAGAAFAQQASEVDQQIKSQRVLGYNKLHGGDVEGARVVFEGMVRDQPKRWEGYYDLACFHARQGQPDQGLDWLGKAVERGCDDHTTFRQDSDLDALRKHAPELFESLAARVAVAEKQSRARQILERASTLENKLAEGALFPFDFELEQLTSEGKVKLGDFAGKVMIVDIWGTWCPPCRREVPHFIDLYQRYRDHGLAIVGINFERDATNPRAYLGLEQARDLAIGAARAMGINYPLLHGVDSIIAQVPGFRGFPTTLFIDHRGRVRAAEVGYKPITALETLVVSLLAERMRDEAPSEGSSAGVEGEPGER